MNALTVTDRRARHPAERTPCHGIVFESRVAVNGRPRPWLGIQRRGQLARRAAQDLDADRHARASGPFAYGMHATHDIERAPRRFVRAEQPTFLDDPLVIVVDEAAS